jgi:hypothetical protein
MIARVPGIGLRNAKRIVELRRLRRIRWEDLSRLRCSMKKIAPFVVTADYKPAQGAGQLPTCCGAMAAPAADEPVAGTAGRMNAPRRRSCVAAGQPLLVSASRVARGGARPAGPRRGAGTGHLERGQECAGPTCSRVRRPTRSR